LPSRKRTLKALSRHSVVNFAPFEIVKLLVVVVVEIVVVVVVVVVVAVVVIAVGGPVMDGVKKRLLK